MKQQELIPHLFRTEYSKITAVLCRYFGMEQLELAEDIAGETFLAALESWPYRGIPENPAAWLYTVAKNKARNHFARRHTFRASISPALQQAAPAMEGTDIDLSGQHIADSQLQMLFAICHPAIAPEAQIGLALRILCGFGIDEIADALLTTKENINKRLYRAREKLRQEKVAMVFPAAAEVHLRLNTVLTTLYLLFNEGYYSESSNSVLREDLCQEAMRLCLLLTDNPATDLPPVNALLALMCFHASRFPARKDANGEIVLYHAQDTTRWDQEMVRRGVYYLHKAATGNRLSRFHLEAAIAYHHTIREDTAEKWGAILQLYNQLLALHYSPVAALNRTFALSKVKGRAAAIAEAEKLQLTGNHYYYTLLGALYRGISNHKAQECLRAAYQLARTEADRKVIREMMAELYL
ncbi:RNA polymerase sigma factor [Chitinophaga alhagiae]|uniref:RNA polymerase sigma factor n=1 Tax=Chitinophaga alhagiae TaxID=2203219 RepID=UPI000E5BA1C1|nr:sigma-70 family RNA polymerase sigma factor [Chitinophaga alhagiae]